MLACGESQPPVPQDAETSQAEAAKEAALDKARAAAKALGADLMSTMAQEMAEGGPAAALRVCSEVAQEISAQHSSDDVQVRRVTLQARNPRNRPDDYERDKLKELQAFHDQDVMPAEIFEVVERNGERELRYLKPIETAELCLACHGAEENLAPEVRDLIAERYPEDEATGYSAGQFRGAVSVQVRLEGE